MKVFVVLFLFASFVKPEFSYFNEVEKFKNQMYFVHHLAKGSFVDQEILKACLGASLVVPKKMNFQGSEYILKLLRGAYFFDLKNENIKSQLMSSVFQQALIASNRAVADEPMSIFTGFMMEDELKSNSPDQCKLSPEDIYQQIITKFPNNCIVPSQAEISFQEKDLQALPGYTKECPQKLNRVASSIIQGFNEITSEGIIDIQPYFDALKLLYLTSGYYLIYEIYNHEIFHLRFLLLNELILSRLDSIPENMLKDKLKDMKSYVKQCKSDLSFEFLTNTRNKVSENAELELGALSIITLNKDLYNPYVDYKEKTLKVLLESVEVKNQRIIV